MKAYLQKTVVIENDQGCTTYKYYKLENGETCVSSDWYSHGRGFDTFITPVFAKDIDLLKNYDYDIRKILLDIVKPEYYECPEGELWWCTSHNRRATHIWAKPGCEERHTCGPGKGGIMIPCFAKQVTELPEPANDNSPFNCRSNSIG